MTREFSCELKMDKEDQEIFLHDNVIGEAIISLTTGNKHMLVCTANTNAGKTFVIANYLVPSLVKLNIPNVKPLRNFIIIAPPTEVRDDIRKTFKGMNYKQIDGKTVAVYQEKDLIEVAQGLSNLNGEINILIVTNAWFNMNYDLIHDNDYIKFDCVINDESHYANGVPHVVDMKISTGSQNNNAPLVTFTNLANMRKAGALVIQYSATPTRSQQGFTHYGGLAYKQLPIMPFNDMKAPFVHFVSSTLEDSYSTITDWYRNQVQVISDLQNKITPATWNLMSKDSPIRKMMPAVSIRIGANSAKKERGKTWGQLQKTIQSDCTTEGWDLVDLVDNLEYAGTPVKKTIDAIDLANSKANENRPAMFIVKNKLQMGANIPRLAVTGVVRIPSQEIAENNWVQYYARTSRLPYFRRHDLARDYIYNLPISYEQKELICLLYVYMSSAICIMLIESSLLDGKVVAAYSEGKKSITAGLAYFLDHLKDGHLNSKQFGSTIMANSRYKDYIKATFCEHCPTGDNGLAKCLMNLYEAVCSDIEPMEFEQFMNVACNIYDIDHKDGNRHNNEIGNWSPGCSNFHRIKTFIQGDFLNRYEDGQLLARLIPGKEVKLTFA